MAKRITTNMTGLVVHVIGSKIYMSEESLLRRKFKKGTITTQELRKLASFMAIGKSNKSKMEIEVEITVKKLQIPTYHIKCWNVWIECTKAQYDSAPLNARKIVYKEI